MLTLVDTSVWISHFRKSDCRVVELLESRQITMHSAVLGELAAGSLKNRIKVLSDLKLIPRLQEVSANEVLEFVENNRLFNQGLSWVDLLILASVQTARCDLMTDDKRLMKAFNSLRNLRAFK